MKTDNRNIFAVKSFLREYLDLRKDKDNELETIDSIRKGVEFKGANLWILIFAIFMASLGLNVNYRSNYRCDVDFPLDGTYYGSGVIRRAERL